MRKKKKRTGKAFMIAMPVASMIGGMMTPAGSSLNLLAIGLLEQLSPGSTITFVQWMCVGTPLAIVLVPIAWFIMVKVYKPAEIDKDKVLGFIDKLEVPKKVGNKEIKVIIITLAMLVLWILSSWIRSIDVYVVALISVVVFLMLILIPIAPALITVLAGPLATVAVSQGYSPEILFLTLALCASNCYLFPIDSVPLLTYGTGYYKMTDMPKSTAIIQVIMIVILSAWLPVISKLLGII